MRMRSGGGGIKSISSDPFVNLDGRLNAPSGTPQFATLLNGYPSATPPGGRVRWPTLTGTQPQWKAAGIDYDVGIDRALYPTNGNLKDPAPGGTLAAALTALGGTLSTNRIAFNGSSANNAIIDGYNFTLHSGLSLQFSNCSNPAVQNSAFQVGADTENGAIQFLASVTGGATARKNEIDGNNLGAIGFGLITSNAAGTTLVEYNLLQNAAAEAIVYGTTTTPGIHITRDNVFRNTLGNRLNYHGDWVQEVTSPGQLTTSTEYSFNTFIVDITGTATQGLSIFTANEAMGECLSVAVKNNTFVSSSATFNQPNYDILVNPTYVSGTVEISQNFADTTGNNAGFLFYGSGGSSGPFTPTLNKSGNVKMTDGSTLT